MEKLYTPVYEYEIDGKVWKFNAPKVKAVAQFQESSATDATWENIANFMAKMLKKNHKGMTGERVMELFALPIMQGIIHEILNTDVTIADLTSDPEKND